MVDIKSTAFPKLSDEQMQAVNKFTTVSSFSDGDTLFSSGDKNAKFFIIKSGQVEIIERSTGKRHSVTVHDPGEFTGELNMLNGRPSVVSAIAKGDCQVYEVSYDDLHRILQQIPLLGDCILQAFIARRRLLEESEFSGLSVVGSKFSQDTARIKGFLAKNKIPFTWIDLEKDADVGQLLEQFGISKEETPVVACGAHQVLRNPSNEALGELAGIKKPLGNEVYDLVVVGAGPAGLAAAVYGASEGLNTLILERTAPGGQAGSSSKIENYMGFPTGLSGTDLADRATIQAEKFGATFSTPSQVTGLSFENGYKTVHLDGGDSVSAQCVLISTGASYRKLDAEGCDLLEGRGIYYSATAVEAQLCERGQVVVVGGGNSAGQAAIFLSNYAKKVILMIRGDNLKKKMSHYLVQRIENSECIELMTDTEISKIIGEESLHTVEIINNQTQKTQTIDLIGLFVFIGAVPRTDWLPPEIERDEKGFIKTGLEVAQSKYWQANRQPFFLETSQPGVFAAGDVRSDSIKRVASAVGEGSMTVKFAHHAMAS